MDNRLKLSSNEINESLSKLANGWFLSPEGHLSKDYKFNDFVDCMGFVTKMSLIAEAKCHHPDLFISYNSCKIRIWTHDVNGLTESDFELASHINKIS